MTLSIIQSFGMSMAGCVVECLLVSIVNVNKKLVRKLQSENKNRRVMHFFFFLSEFCISKRRKKTKVGIQRKPQK